MNERPESDEVPDDFDATFAPADGESEPAESESTEFGEATFVMSDSKVDWPRIPDVDLEREIGRGGMGVVYSGKQNYIDRRVAVKLLAITDRGPTFAQRFQREAKILASLSHPNIVSCYSAGTLEDGKCFLVMEYIDGPNLLQWIEESGRMDPTTALGVTRDVARALQCAYEKTIIHRDVKPANVLLQRGTSVDSAFPFKPKLADLGLARPTSGDSTLMDLTQQGAVMGSPPTMSPEQFDDPDNVDYRTDIYALGCTLYHMVTGSLAFPQKSLTETITRKMAEESPDPCEHCDDLGAEVSGFIRRMLARRADDRPQSYAEVVQRCDELMELAARAAGGRPRLRAAAPAAGGTQRAVPVAPIVGGLGALGLALGAWWLAGSGDEPGGVPEEPVRTASADGDDRAASGPVDQDQDPGGTTIDGASASVTPNVPEGSETPDGAGQGTGAPSIPLDDSDAAALLGPGGEGAAPEDPGASALERTDGSSSVDGAGDPTPPDPGGADGDASAASSEEGSGGLEAPGTTNTPGSAEPEPARFELAPGETLELFDREGTYPIPTWEHGPGSSDDAWSHPVLGASDRVIFTINELGKVGSASVELPGGSWRLDASMRLVNPKRGVDRRALLRVEFEHGTAVGLQLSRRKGPNDDEQRIYAEGLRQRREGDAWVTVEPIEAVSWGGLDATEYYDADGGWWDLEIEWDGDELYLAPEFRPSSSLGVRQTSIRPTAREGTAPTRLAVEVESMQVQLERFVLSGR